MYNMKPYIKPNAKTINRVCLCVCVLILVLVFSIFECEYWTIVRALNCTLNGVSSKIQLLEIESNYTQFANNKPLENW